MNREKELFNAALELPESKREEFLTAAAMGIGRDIFPAKWLKAARFFAIITR